MFWRKVNTVCWRLRTSSINWRPKTSSSAAVISLIYVTGQSLLYVITSCSVRWVKDLYYKSESESIRSVFLILLYCLHCSLWVLLQVWTLCILWSSFDIEWSVVVVSTWLLPFPYAPKNNGMQWSDLCGMKVYQGQKSINFQHNMGTVLCRSGEHHRSLEWKHPTSSTSKVKLTVFGIHKDQFWTLLREGHNSK